MLPWWLASLIFFSVLGLLVGSQVFWFWQGRRFLRSRRAAWQRWLLGVPLYAWFLGLAGIFLLAPLRWFAAGDAPVLLSLFMQVRRPAVMVPLGLWVSASMLAFVLIALVQGIGWGAGWLRRLVPAAGASDAVVPERRYFLQTATYAAGALPFIAVGYGFLIGRQNYTVEEVAVPIRNLPPALDGLRIVQLTDVHASAYMPVSEIRRVVGMAQELEPDLVFHTGDFLTSRGDPLEPAIDELSRVEGRYARFGCLGNHEIYARAEDAATQLCARRGVRILRGESVELEIRGAKLNLIGVDYQRQPASALRASAGRPRSSRFEDWAPHFLRGVERLVRPDAVNLLLSHNPNAFLRAAELGIELTLAGHTHGGQVQVEILHSRWAVPRFITPFISGLYSRPMTGLPVAGATGLGATTESVSTGHGSRDTGLPAEALAKAGRCFLYVSRGIGTIAAPIRLNAPPEITLLTLRRAV